MSRSTNEERDNLILEFIDKRGKTRREVAKFFNMAVSSIQEAYYRAKNKDKK